MPNPDRSGNFIPGNNPVSLADYQPQGAALDRYMQMLAALQAKPSSGMDAAQQRGEDLLNYGQQQQRTTADVLRPSQYGTPVWGSGRGAEQLHDLPYPGREQPHPIMKAAHAIGQADPMGTLSKIMMFLTPKANPFQYGRGANPEEP